MAELFLSYDLFRLCPGRNSVKMLKLAPIFCALLVSVYGAGEFSVLTHPGSTIFKGHDHIKESLLPEVYSAALGFTTEQNSNWQGMFLKDPFNLAKAIVTVAVDGVTEIGQTEGHHFPMKTDEGEEFLFETMSRRIQDRHPSTQSHLVRVDLSQGLKSILEVDAFKGVKDVAVDKEIKSALKLSVDEDRTFLEEMAFFNALIEKIEKGNIKKTNLPDVFWFKISSLHAISDLHGENSTETKEAKEILVNAIERMNAAFNKFYDGKVLVNVITSDTSHTRRVRRETEEKPDQFKTLNLSKDYDSNYPVIFNIILWFGVIMVFTLLAISLFIGNMDPGRDSIIYRMTNTRMKKDN
ncbi:PREDICTED: renin receptor [Nicrophorus vespilloides]|uniref:Renin receptor n=1 Tax=Nicrophorus vespilloides TaxID=110193 RepID=A0ABM1MNB4_NICVS|nr:PREDICTED: renin receptor [Nicrophorus vespilloides]